MKPVLFFAVLVLGSALIQSQTFADMPEPTAKENPSVAGGRKAIEAKDFKAAIGYLTKAVKEEPDNADAHSMLGFSYRKSGDFDKSMEQYQRALKIDGNHRSAHEYLGELYLEMNQPANAEKQLTALKKACPFFGKCEEYEDLKEAIEKFKVKK